MLATCNVEIDPGHKCGWQVPWDEHGKALMKEHFKDKHPGINLYAR